MKHRSVIKLLYFSLVALITAYCLSQATATDDTTTLFLDRKEVNYLFNLPTAHEAGYLFFTWTVKTDPSCAGQMVVLQFSHDGKEWNNLANAIVDSNGMASHDQPVDSSWAIEGRNYLRVVIGKEASNIVIFTVNEGIGYWIIEGTIAFGSVVVALWCITTRIQKPKGFEKLA